MSKPATWRIALEDPLRPDIAYFVEPLGVKVPSHLAAYVQMPYS